MSTPTHSTAVCALVCSLLFSTRAQSFIDPSRTLRGPLRRPTVPTARGRACQRSDASLPLRSPGRAPRHGRQAHSPACAARVAWAACCMRHPLWLLWPDALCEAASSSSHTALRMAAVTQAPASQLIPSFPGPQGGVMNGHMTSHDLVRLRLRWTGKRSFLFH